MFYIDIKRLRDDVILPSRGSKEAAGFDLYAWSYEKFDYPEEVDWAVVIPPGGSVKVRTGIAVSLPEGTFGGVYARSGLATKQGLAPANKVGIIDSDYRGEIMVVLYNQSSLPQTLHKNDRIAQLVIQPYIEATWIETDTLDETERGDGGFGSSGVNKN